MFQMRMRKSLRSNVSSGPLKLLLALSFITALLSTNDLLGDIIVDVSDTTIAAGGIGTVDVFISSTGTDDIEFASYAFAITAIGSPGSTLEFEYPPDFSESLIGGPNGYVFVGDSLGIDYDDINSTNSTYIGFDGVDVGPSVTIDSTEKLLVRLDLRHTLGTGQSPALADGEQFRITLQDVGDTYFDFADIDASSYLTAVGGGIITVQAA
ncbi:MAG: hypothetical protein KDA89_07115, partial [Planctomycetaceae bacterium]|nr:hypothetical protein [Planctomycetaceae bacterium]